MRKLQEKDMVPTRKQQANNQISKQSKEDSKQAKTSKQDSQQDRKQNRKQASQRNSKQDNKQRKKNLKKTEWDHEIAKRTNWSKKQPDSDQLGGVVDVGPGTAHRQGS